MIFVRAALVKCWYGGMTETVLCGYFVNSAIGGMSETLIRKGLRENPAAKIYRKFLSDKYLGFFKEIC